MMVTRDGVEPPTPAFSVFNQQLNLSEWPNYCDHAVTSAGVRLSVGNGLRNPGTSCFKKTESNLGLATRPCRCVGESQVVTPEKPSHPPLSPPLCRIGTAGLGVRALCEILPARLPP